MLRQCLAEYVKHTPASLRFGYMMPHGKPFLAEYPEIAFNLSHAGDYGLLAVTCGRQVGVDIELIQRLPGTFSRTQSNPNWLN
jgi:4'-phosphopantetheinyl transferase